MSETEFDAKTHWEKAYSERQASEKSWHQEVPTLSLAMIERSGVGRDEPIIDVGGGASLLVDHLLDLGYRDLTVLDLSSAALQQARSRLGSRAAGVTWTVADITRFDSDRRFALWHDRAAFHFLTHPSDRSAYVDCMTRQLKSGGQAILATFAPDGPKRCSGRDIVRYDGQSLGAVIGKAFVLEEEQRETHRTPAGREQRFGFYRFRKVA